MKKLTDYTRKDLLNSLYLLHMYLEKYKDGSYDELAVDEMIRVGERYRKELREIK